MHNISGKYIREAVLKAIQTAFAEELLELTHKKEVAEEEEDDKAIEFFQKQYDELLAKKLYPLLVYFRNYLLLFEIDTTFTLSLAIPLNPCVYPSHIWDGVRRIHNNFRWRMTLIILDPHYKRSTSLNSIRCTFKSIS